VPKVAENVIPDTEKTILNRERSTRTIYGVEYRAARLAGVRQEHPTTGSQNRVWRTTEH
jgi:hypothetical protein